MIKEQKPVAIHAALPLRLAAVGFKMYGDTMLETRVVTMYVVRPRDIVYRYFSSWYRANVRTGHTFRRRFEDETSAPVTYAKGPNPNPKKKNLTSTIEPWNLQVVNTRFSWLV